MKPSPWHRLNHGGPSSLPPHPATVVQPKAPHPAMVAQPKALPPHPATVVQPKRPLGAPPAPPPRPATTAGSGWGRLVQRAEALPKESLGKMDDKKIELIAKKEWQKLVKKQPVTVRAFVYEVAPGIAVEIEDDADLSFPLFIAELIEEIRRVPVGRNLIGEFEPRNGFLTPGEEPYKGVTLLVCKMENTKDLETKSFGGRKVDGGWKFVDKWSLVPRVIFPNRPSGKDVVQIGLEKADYLGNKSYPAFATSDGVVKHSDFPDEVAPYDVIFFHEMCHAYYLQIGLSAQFYQVPPIVGANDSGNTFEEMLVCGLGWGRGLEYCENNYRVQAKFADLRRTYRAVQLVDEEVNMSDWQGPSYVHPLTVMGLAKIKDAKLRTKGTERWAKPIYDG